ncbi:MAG: DUF6067 family protein [Candidatus Omnitrophica bacterium]|nr:DUF6067 family protein [Candidatus Omnitrophota bacterium]
MAEVISSFRLTLMFAVAFVSLTRLVSGEDLNKPKHRPQFVIPYFQIPPVIDGLIREEEWPGIKIKGLISQQRPNRLEFRDVEAWLGWDEKNIYVAVKSVYHPEAGLIAPTQPVPDNGDASFKSWDDTLEFFFVPDMVAEEENLRPDRVYQIILNANQAIYDIVSDQKKGSYNTAWRVKQRSAHTVKDGYWQAEIAFDLTSFEVKDLNNWWGVRICRNFKNPWDQSRLGINVIAFASVETMPLMKLSRLAPSVKHHSFYDEKNKRVNLKLSLANPTEQAIPVKAVLAHNPLNQPRYEKKGEYVLKPGESQELIYQIPMADPQAYTAVSLVEVTSPDGKIIYYRRDFLWEAMPTGQIWTPVPKADIKAVSLNIAHYPRVRKLVVLASFEHLAGRESVKEATIEVTPAGQERVLARKKISEFNNFGLETVLDLPEGMKGEYEVKLFLTGEGNLPQEPVVEKFERERFEWEGNRLGMTNQVIPPFQPIKINWAKKTAAVVLRHYTFSPLGLWQQVEADGKEILAEPISLKLVQAGTTRKLEGKGVRFTKVKPNEVSGKCGRRTFWNHHFQFGI